MRERNKERFIFDINKSDCLLKLGGKKLNKFSVAVVLPKISKLRLAREMRQKRLNVFHGVIIASLCCIVLAGCGHKTDVVYVPDGKKTTQAK
jgi:hypothetical protein